MADEIRRVNKAIEKWLRNDERLIATLDGFPANACQHMIYKQVYNNNGYGPKPFTQLQASSNMLLGNTITTRGIARQQSFEILDVLIASITRLPDHQGRIDQSEAAERLLTWLWQTTPASDIVATYNQPRTPSPTSMTGPHNLAPTNNSPPSSSMDPLSDVGGVHLGRHRDVNAIHSQDAGPSNDSNAPVAGMVRRLNQHSLGQKQSNGSNGRDGQKEHQSPNPVEDEAKQDTVRQQPSSTSQQADSNTQAVHVSQPPSILAPQPQSSIQPAFINMPASGPTLPHAVTTTAAVPYQAYYPFPLTAPTPNVPYQQFGALHQGPPPPFVTSGMPPPMYGMQTQPHAFMIGNYRPAYGQFHTMPQHAFPIHPYGFAPGYSALQQQLPVVGQQILPMVSKVHGRPTIKALPSSNPTPVRTTLPPAERLSTQSVWAKSKEFNVAEWAQENRPQTPIASSSRALNTQAQAVVANPQVTAATMPTLRYRVGMDTMYPRLVGGVSTQLLELTKYGIPTFSTATSSTIFPFEGIARLGGPPPWGVVRIGNIPYGLTRPEVTAFLGRHARILTPNLGCAIHITMDRLTGKTMDCFVEFLSVADALAFVSSKNQPGQTPKLADRVPIVQISSQDLLLQHMFPRARNTTWQNGVPMITNNNDPFNTGYKGLVTHEEMVKMVQHAEFPQRSNYTAKCLQRVYECMISTLNKFPWYAVDAYTIGTRNQIFAASNDLLRILLFNAKKGIHPLLNQALLQELLYAGLNAAGFSEKQRWELTRTAELTGRAVRISPLAKNWPFEVLGRKPDVPEDLISWYVDRLTHHLDRPGIRPTTNPFRTFLLPPNKGDDATVNEQGALEMKCVVDLYRMTLPEGGR